MWNWVKPANLGTIKISQGDAGKWRWQAYDLQGNHRFGQTIRGSETREGCVADIVRLKLHTRYVIEGASEEC